MRGLLLIIVLLAATTARGNDLVGTWMLPDGDVVAFQADGTGINLTKGDSDVGFRYKITEPGLATLVGDGVATEYRYVTDGASLLLMTHNHNVLAAVRVEAAPELAFANAYLARTIGYPFMNPKSRVLDELDEFAGHKAAERRPDLTAADVAGTWAGHDVPVDRISAFGIAVIREDGTGLIATDDCSDRPSQILVTPTGSNTLQIRLSQSSKTRPDQSLRLIVTGDNALLIPEFEQGVSGVPAGHVDRLLLLVRTDEAPSAAVRRLILEQSEARGGSPRPTSRPSTRPLG